MKLCGKDTAEDRNDSNSERNVLKVPVNLDVVGGRYMLKIVNFDEHN